MNTEIKLRKNGHKHGGGWNDNTPRKPLSEKMVAVTVLVKRKYMLEAIKHLRNEAEKFRK